MDGYICVRRVYVADIMGWKKLFLTVGIFIVMPAYFLYSPIPDGYSTVSACKMQLKLATLKTVDAVVGTLSETVFIIVCFENYHLLICAPNL